MNRTIDLPARVVGGIAWPLVSEVNVVQEIYEHIRRQGATHDLGVELTARKLRERNLHGVTVGRAWFSLEPPDPDLKDRLKDMLDARQGPTLHSDTTWLTAVGCGKQWDGVEGLGDFYAKEARAAGHNISGAVYLSSLARYPGDPEAWVRDLGEVRKICEARGWSCEGAVKVKPRTDVEPEPDIDVADDIVEAKVLSMMAANPDLQLTEELVYEAKQAIKPHWAA